ncbi:hypothetical protein PN462_04925 [Spirulina sp. CS-785/01]|uniref:hypothetical protein n=1 Tax=Spirulina sp. CS-785/01 TaxID=3021716 RepID=UPI00232CE977|nr:hypothetical protein [Spirulina sp. CS-785/01]MDB9312439.1 hypothetical protein [Spirulina sp. CS-785/01]
MLISEVLRSCNFEIVYDTDDYMMGREIPGRVSFTQLVTVEALVDKSHTNQQEVRMNCVIKNEELPLKVNNHCRRMFDTVKQAIAEKAELQVH